MQRICLWGKRGLVVLCLLTYRCSSVHLVLDNLAISQIRCSQLIRRPGAASSPPPSVLSCQTAIELHSSAQPDLHAAAGHKQHAIARPHHAFCSALAAGAGDEHADVRLTSRISRRMSSDSWHLQASCGSYVAAWDWQRVKEAMKAGRRRLTNQFLICQVLV